MDTSIPPSSDTATPSSVNEQARLRKERREAKIRAGGSGRLSKISALSGRPAEPAAVPAPSSTVPGPTASATDTSTPDPDEVDISQHFYRPGQPPFSRSSRPDHPGMSEEDLRRLMLSYDTPPPPQASTGVFPGSAGGTAPMPGQAPRPPGAGDPMMQLMQQMMGGEGAGGADGGLGGSGAPPGLAEFLAQAGGGVSQAQSGPDNSYVWRIIHAVCALTLGLVAITSIHFSGSLSQRNAPTITYTPSLVSPTSPLAILNTLASSIATNPFLGFTTMELVLQSARFFIEKSRLLPSTASPPSAMLNTVLPLIPPPYRAWVEVASRYAVIYSTVMADAMLLVFVLGVGAWWNASRW